MPVEWPSKPDPWLQDWVIWRFLNKPDPRPPAVPPNLGLVRFKYAWDVLKWAGWRRAGAHPPRPDVDPTIPKWAWTLLANLNHAVPRPTPPPKPKPPPVPQPPPSSWDLPGPFGFTAWGFHDHPASWPDTLASEMKNANVGTVMIQIGEADPEVALHFTSRGIAVALWGIASEDDQAALDSFDADGYCPQIEGPNQRDAAYASLAAGTGHGRSKAIVTTFSGIEDGATWYPKFAALDCDHLLVECYRTDGPNQGNVPLMMWTAANYGWPSSDPIVGLYGGSRLGDYNLTAMGRDWGWWDCEQMNEADWAAIKTTGA